ncbi:MAG: hypothetical protein AB7S26_09850 [Sandaracinaceae bacterium]
MILALTIALACAGCIEPQDHGGRDSGADAGPSGDAGPPSMVDAGPPSGDAGSTIDAGDVLAPPPLLMIAISSGERVEVRSMGSSLVPTRVPSQTIQVGAGISDASITLHPSGTLDGCDLYPPVGTSSWPPSTIVPGESLPLPLEYVTITVDGAPIVAEAGPGDTVFVRLAEAPGARIAVTVAYPGQTPIHREVVLGPPMAVTTPANAPRVDGYLGADYTAGTDLHVVWDVAHDPSATQIVDLTGGSRGAVRCSLTHGDGMLTFPGADIGAQLLAPSDPSLSINLYSTRAVEAMEGSTLVRVRESWSGPSIVAAVQ